MSNYEGIITFRNHKTRFIQIWEDGTVVNNKIEQWQVQLTESPQPKKGIRKNYIETAGWVCIAQFYDEINALQFLTVFIK